MPDYITKELGNLIKQGAGDYSLCATINGKPVAAALVVIDEKLKVKVFDFTEQP